VLAWLGLDEVRLPRPVRFGDTIHTEVVVTTCRPTSKPGRGLVGLHYDVRNQHDETVMTFTSTLIPKMATTGA
jgi:acyl dehydratase